MKPVTNKQGLVDNVIAMGYQAEIIDGLPYIIGVNYPKAEKVVKDLGYKGSYGIRIKQIGE